jgi:phosphate transport system substrate-binding protein
MTRLAVAIAASLLLCLPGCGPSSESDITLNGAGATFPYPLYSKWAHSYEQTSGIRINYQSIGSGGGISQIKSRTVDFGASDAPLTKDELEAAGLIQFPLVIGGVVPVVNLPGIEPGKLQLTADVLSEIYLGTLKHWDDPALRELNPDLKLPNTEIRPVHRADGSGTTWIFTSYLGETSKNWQSKVGVGKAVSWPEGGMGGKGNEGVATYVKNLEGAIGYVEYAYALQNKMNHALLKNKAGKFVQPTIESFQAAAASADWKNAPGYYMVLVDQPGDESWPITGASFILIHKQQADAAKAEALLKFFDWCFRHGADSAKELHYVPIPKTVYEMVEGTWASVVRAAGNAVRL